MKRTINTKLEEIKNLLQEVNKEELMRLRLSGNFGVVLKIDNKYFFLPDKSKASIARYALGEHLCGKCELGSETICPKIMDWFVKVFEEEGIVGPYAVRKAKRIEKYDFITDGVEAFNTSDYYMVVTKCSKYQEAKPIQKREDPISRITIPAHAYQSKKDGEGFKFCSYGFC